MAELVFNCDRCDSKDISEINVDKLRSSSDPYSNVAKILPELGPDVVTGVGGVCVACIKAYLEILDSIDEHQEGKCPNCGKDYPQGDLPPEDDPAFHLKGPNF